MIGGLAALLTDTVTVLAPGTKVMRSGTTSQDWSQPVVVATVAAAVQGRTGSEDRDAREAAISQWRVYVAAGTVVDRTARLQWHDRMLEVVGVPRPVHNHLTGALQHWEIDAREVVG